MASSKLVRVFVYGTLKRKQCRGGAWPRTPVTVQDAFTLGELYDLGPYPAMTAGEDVVSGELWTFRPIDMAATLEKLDEIEDVADGMYERVQIDCWLSSDAEEREPKLLAYTYFYRLSLESATRLHHRLQGGGFCSWP